MGSRKKGPRSKIFRCLEFERENPHDHRYEGGTIMPTVAESLVATLAAAGVKRIYGIVGDSLNGITDAMRRHKTIDWVHVRHEEVPAFPRGPDPHVPTGRARRPGGAGPGNPPLYN